MSDTPNPSDFSRDEKPGQYDVRFRVEGYVRMTIQADSEADARAKAEAMMDDEDFGEQLDSTTDVTLDWLRKSQAMYRVTREGKKMQVSHLAPGDIPREPDGYGF